jgi:hypothetical protein
VVTSSLPFAGVGLLFFILFRTGLRREDYTHFGVWHHAPRWARILFGSVGGSISPYRLSVEVFGLTWTVCWLGIVATGDPPGSPLRQILAAALIAALVGCVVCWVVVSVGQVLRDWRKR